MKFRLQAFLDATPPQAEQLRRLQSEFANVCNAIAPTAHRTQCWNRVALHHMVYREMRERFPNLGSQMVCNAIYAVSRTCREVYQHPDSPFHIARVGPAGLPLVQFAPGAPVYFDWHTLSIKDGRASLYTLDGRLHFEVRLPPEDLRRLVTSKLREIALTRQDSRYVLTFQLDTKPESTRRRPAPQLRGKPGDPPPRDAESLPEYVHLVHRPPTHPSLTPAHQEST